MVVIDEAHKLRGDETIVSLLKEARKYGLGLILSSQETRGFHPSVFANTGTLIGLALETVDATVMAKHLRKGRGLRRGRGQTEFQVNLKLGLTPYAPLSFAALGKPAIAAVNGGVTVVLATTAIVDFLAFLAATGDEGLVGVEKIGLPPTVGFVGPGLRGVRAGFRFSM